MTCRLCGDSEYDKGHKYPIIHYATRHNVHVDCGLKRWGADFFDRLHTNQLRQFPALAAADFGLLETLIAEIDKRGDKWWSEKRYPPRVLPTMRKAESDTLQGPEVTPEPETPETPFDDEAADIQYRESMKDAGRGYLLR